MLKFTRITHQFTLFDYNEMRPKLKVPIKRISKERMEEAIKEFNKSKGSDGKSLINVLRDLNDSLDNYCKRHNIQ